MIIREYHSRADAQLILIDNDQEVINTLNQAEYNLVEKKDDTRLVLGDFNLKASHTLENPVRKYRKISSKIKDTICDIASELGNIGYERHGYKLNENEIQEKIVFSALIFFKKPEADQQSSENITELVGPMENL